MTFLLTTAWPLEKRFWSEAFAVVLAMALWLAFLTYRDAQREIGKREVRLAALDSSLRVVRAEKARVDTVREVAVKRFTQTVTAWQHDTVRVTVMATPDSDCISAAVVKPLLARDSVVIANGVAALAASDSSRQASERAALLWKAKAETVAPSLPVIRYEPSRGHRVRDWVEHALVVGLAAKVVHDQVKR